jgi:hypothetical protein
MTFEHPWLLLIAWTPLLWVWYEWRDSGRRIALCLKAAGLTAALLALTEPRISIDETKVAAAILVDTSASMSAGDLARASEIASQIESTRAARPILRARSAMGWRRCPPGWFPASC